MLSEQQIKAFSKNGYIELKQAFSFDSALKMQNLIWDSLNEQYGIIKDDRNSWNKKPPFKLQHLKGNALFQPIWSDLLSISLQQIFGSNNWIIPNNWGQFLLAFPSGLPWIVPHSTWHTDFDFVERKESIRGLLVFIFITDVGVEGGGTCIISGSHRLMQLFVENQSSELRSRMKRIRKAFMNSDQWLRDLENPAIANRNSIFLENQKTIQGIDLTISQLTGKAGDIVVAHPWLVHCPAMNSSRDVKIMRVQRIYSQSDA